MTPTNKQPAGISYKLLGALVITFIAGLVVDQISRNVLQAEQIQFSTLSLIAFLFSIILSGASIVLAISAIMLGKNSEIAMIQRTDESIRLQNEVFAKTTDALQRILSSTGVTEKRLEDIISGRVGVISQKIAEIADRGSTAKDTKQLVKEIQESILRQLSPETVSPQVDEEVRRLLEQSKSYEVFHSRVLSVFANQHGFTAHKLGSGKFEGETDQLFDAIYMIGDKRIGVSALSESHLKTVFEGSYLDRIAHCIHIGSINSAYLVADASREAQHELQERIRIKIETIDTSMIDRIYLISSPVNELEKAISEFLKAWFEQTAPSTAHPVIRRSKTAVIKLRSSVN
jgi:hypothetical protein